MPKPHAKPIQMKLKKALTIGILMSLVWTLSGQDNRFSEAHFDKVINSEFKSLVTGGTVTAPGKYAAIDPMSGEVNLSTYFSFNNGNLLNISATGTSIDGIIPVFTNSRLNTGINLSLEYHILAKSRNDFIIEDDAQVGQLESRLSVLRRTYDYEIWKLNNRFRAQEVRNELLKLDSEINELVNKIPDIFQTRGELIAVFTDIWDEVQDEHKAWVSTQLTNLKNTPLEFDLLFPFKAELEKAIILVEDPDSKTKEKANSLISLLNEEQWLSTINSIWEKTFLKEQKEEELEEAESRPTTLEKEILDTKLRSDIQKVYNEIKPLEAASFGWWSFGIGITNNSYNLLDPEQELASQITDTTSLRRELKVQYSRYGWSQDLKTTFFYNVGASVSATDNIAALKKVTVEDITVLAESDEVTRQRSSEIIAYQGAYNSGLVKGNLFANYYLFFKDRQVGLHLNGNGNFLEDEKPVWNAELGLILSFIDQDKKDATVNVELYYALNNLGDSLDTGTTFFERNSVGIRLAVPVAFN